MEDYCRLLVVSKSSWIVSVLAEVLSSLADLSGIVLGGRYFILTMSFDSCVCRASVVDESCLSCRHTNFPKCFPTCADKVVLFKSARVGKSLQHRNYVVAQ